MKLLTIAAVCLIAAGPALAQSTGEKTGVNSTLGIAPKTADFVTEAASSDMFEIESSKLAATKTQGDVKAFAEQMITDHTKTSNELKSMVSSGDVKADVPKDLDKSSQDKLDKLRNAKQAVRAGDWKGIRRNLQKGTAKLELYNLKDDPAETTDVSGKHPEVVKRLERILDTGRTPSKLFPIKGLE